MQIMDSIHDFAHMSRSTLPQLSRYHAPQCHTVMLSRSCSRLSHSSRSHSSPSFPRSHSYLSCSLTLALARFLPFLTRSLISLFLTLALDRLLPFLTHSLISLSLSLSLILASEKKKKLERNSEEKKKKRKKKRRRNGQGGSHEEEKKEEKKEKREENLVDVGKSWTQSTICMPCGNRGPHPRFRYPTFVNIFDLILLLSLFIKITFSKTTHTWRWHLRVKLYIVNIQTNSTTS